MHVSERAWRYRLYILLRGRSYFQNYSKRINELTHRDPLSISPERLAKLLSFVQDSNEYYSRLLSQGGGLESLPVLTKEIIRRHFGELQSLPQGSRAFRNSSGGSTGRPVTLIQDANYVSWLNSTRGYYFREFLGIEMNTVKNVWLWGSDRDSLQLKENRIRSRVANFLTPNPPKR